MYVMPGNKVKEVNGDDVYRKEDNYWRKIILGNDVETYMHQMEAKYKGCVIFMIDLSTEEEYRIN